MSRKVLSFCLVIVASLFSHPSFAYLDGFSAGNIMNDYTMSNSSTMTEAEVDAFLHAHNPCNDTDLEKPQRYARTRNLSYHIEDGHFVCLADEKFSGVSLDGVTTFENASAAHVIHFTAVDYDINPQVLLVLLEKEQGLISDTWPDAGQYQIATGYGCPDTAACDTRYYGFINQVQRAAELFHSVLLGYWSNYPVGNNFIRYDVEEDCGGSVVFIENRATSALYRYTPYQPNAASLAAGYGAGDACSSHGNRNFYNLFTDWFGSTQTTPNDTPVTPEPEQPTAPEVPETPEDPAPEDPVPADNPEPETPEEPATPVVVKGDLNGDGDINISDVAKLFAVVQGTIKLSPDSPYFIAADFQGTGTLTIANVAKLFAFVQGNITEL